VIRATRKHATVLLIVVCLCASGGCGELPSNQASDSAGSGAAKVPTPARGVKFVGFDAGPPLVSALEAGQIQGLVLQNPVLIGQEGVKTLVAHLEGQPVERTISTGELLATPENCQEPEIAARLDPPKASESDISSTADQAPKKYRILVIPKGATHVFWQSVHYGALSAAKSLGNVEIIWLSPTKEDDRLDQINLVQRAAALKVNGIVLAPLDAQALVAPVEEAIAAGIPVVIIDSGLASDKPVSYVATDNYHGGVLGAERLAKVLGEEGRVILLRYAPNSEASDQRERGFTDTIARYPRIKLISQDQYAGATAESAQRVAQQLIVRFKGEFDGIFCPNESSTTGMLRALQDAGLLAGAQ
jgi:ribose transport system substrate-binding protein